LLFSSLNLEPGHGNKRNDGIHANMTAEEIRLLNEKRLEKLKDAEIDKYFRQERDDEFKNLKEPTTLLEYDKELN